MYVRFDPKKHEGMQLYELSGSEQDGMLADSIVLSTATFEQASRCPWNYSVETGAKGVDLAQPILAKAISSKEGNKRASRTATVRPVVNALKAAEVQPGPSWQKRHVTLSMVSKADATSSKIAKNSRAKVAVSSKGGKGSGYHRHVGRPGERGGSAAVRAMTTLAKVPLKTKIATMVGGSVIGVAVALMIKHAKKVRADAKFEKQMAKVDAEIAALDNFMSTLKSIPKDDYNAKFFFIKKGIESMMAGKFGENLPLDVVPKLVAELKEINKIFEEYGPELRRSVVRHAYGFHGDLEPPLLLLPSGKETKMRVVYRGAKGGPGSGSYGHAGRPGLVGGSAAGMGRHYTPLGLGTHELDIDTLRGQLPKTVGDDIADVHTKIGSPQIQYHVVPEGYTMSPPADSPMAFYRSLRKIGSSHEAMAADTTVQDKLKTLDDQAAVNALGGNKLLIDKSGVTAAQAGRSAVHILKATFTGAALGAAEEAGRAALSEIRAAIRRGDADAIASFVTKKVPKDDSAYNDIKHLQSVIKYTGKFRGTPDEWASQVVGDPGLSKLILEGLSEAAAKRSRTSARTAAGTILGGARPKIIRRAVSGALGGAALGASGGAASLTGRGGVSHKYVLKQIRSGGQVTMGSGTWATILQKTSDGHVLHVYGID